MLASDRLLTVREIARGGLGFVELVVRQEGRFERVYAVKRPHAHLLADSKMVEAFVEEGRVAGLLRHRNVVPVLDVGEDERGPYLLMDFVEGVPFVALIQHATKQRDFLPLSVVMQIGQQAARGLKAAHELVGVDGTPSPLVHRDVSPQNLLVGYDGVVRVVDFGIAKVLTNEGDTTTAVLKGKCGYMAPEQLRFQVIDGRADLFALGVTLFEALAGVRLYKGGGIEAVAQRIIYEPPPDLSEHRGDAPPELEHLMYDLLAKDREHRVPTAAALIERIDAVLTILKESGEWEDLPSYLDTHLGTRRDAERASRADAIAQARDERTLTATTSKSRARWPIVAALGAATLAAAGIAFYFNTPDEDIPRVATEPAPADTAANFPENEAEIEPEPEVDPTPEPPRVAAEPAATTMMRRRRRPRMRASMVTETPSTPRTTMGLESEFWD